MQRTHNNIFDWVRKERSIEIEKQEFEKKVDAEDSMEVVIYSMSQIVSLSTEDSFVIVIYSMSQTVMLSTADNIVVVMIYSVSQIH